MKNKEYICMYEISYSRFLNLQDYNVLYTSI